MRDRRRESKSDLAEGILREQRTLQRKLAKIRAWLGAESERPAAIAELSSKVKDQIAALPEEQRRLFRTTASLALADLRESEDALERYLDVVQQDLRRRGSHSAAAKAYGTQTAPAVVRLRRGKSGG
jgi:hypothetical protein